MRNFNLILLLSMSIMACEEHELEIPSHKEKIEFPVCEEVEEVFVTSCFISVEDYPYFQFGYDSLSKLLSLRLPVFHEFIEGKIFVSFEVLESGKVTEVKIIKGIGHPYDEKVLNAIQPMPDFIPGTINGVPAKFQMVLPIVFK